MTFGSDDTLTSGRQLTAILSINARPGGRFEGSIRDGGHTYRFSSLHGLPDVARRWISESLEFPADDDGERLPSHAHEKP